MFLDLSMPVMDGWQFIDEYQKVKHNFTKEISIYVVSSSLISDEFVRAREISIVSDYLIKPISNSL